MAASAKTKARLKALRKRHKLGEFSAAARRGKAAKARRRARSTTTARRASTKRATRSSTRTIWNQLNPFAPPDQGQVEDKISPIQRLR